MAGMARSRPVAAASDPVHDVEHTDEISALALPLALAAARPHRRTKLLSNVGAVADEEGDDVDGDVEQDDAEVDAGNVRAGETGGLEAEKGRRRPRGERRGRHLASVIRLWAAAIASAGQRSVGAADAAGDGGGGRER